MEQEERIFTRDEANRTFERLRPLVLDLQEEWERIKALNPEIQKTREKALMDAFSPHGVEYVELVFHLMLVMRQVREMGVLVKDLDKGLCDFPYLKQERVIYRCWQLGEDSIEYWHDVESGFSGREPLGEQDL